MMRILFNFLLLVYLVCEAFAPYAPLSFLPAHFRCKDGRYLFDRWFCDGSPECSKGDDESYGCDKLKCGRGTFKCTDGTCMNITVRCDSKNDCSDGSDEQDCGDEIDVENCPSRGGSFQCDDQSRCIDFKHICDGFCNCMDCSDEHNGCLKYNNYLCDKCSDTCHSSTHEAHKFSKAPSQDIKLSPCKACEHSFSCDQKCLSIEYEKERCLCDENYQSHTLDNFNQETLCRSNVSHENVIIYSTTNEIKMFNLTSNDTIILRKVINCTALAAAHDYVYYATSSEDFARIYKTPISSKGTKLIIQSDYDITSMDVDWITKNIYFTTDEAIMVCSNDGRTCAKLKSCLYCQVKLAPKLGLMFWSEDGVLYHSAMDGSNENNFKNVVDSYERINFLNYSRLLFAVDETKESVFIANEIPFPLVKWTRLYSNFHKQFLIRGNFEGNEFFDINEFENIIYITVENSNNIYQSDNMRQFTLSQIRLTDNSTTAIKYIYVYNRLLQRTKIPNPCTTASCSLCLLRPLTPFIGLNYVCKCENITKFDHKFRCDDKIKLKLKIVPDTTTKTREAYDVKNPSSSLITNSSSKIKTLSIAALVIIMVIVIIAGFFFILRNKKKMIVNNDDIHKALYRNNESITL